MGGFEPGSPTIGISPIDTDLLSVGRQLYVRGWSDPWGSQGFSVEAKPEEICLSVEHVVIWRSGILDHPSLHTATLKTIVGEGW